MTHNTYHTTMTIQEAKKTGPALVELFTKLGMISRPAKRDFTACVLAALESSHTIEDVSDLVDLPRDYTAAIVHRLVRERRVVKLGGTPGKYRKASR